ncbi:MAG: hypothetical protein GWM92_16340 [Gemmatimonadetes bacterium]|nr:hypothetical protein [Gemmatimonadota bacterium]NIR80325.1 hypothetical protein [Gemmatimonadota bacterium]NIT89088.1 hypothetical protein [Gemmatimonadota bacterium]NIU32885.1 hypothetical protein [Gemmatimonadota bacterium]NIU37291.1 hypothetical protein [Gemmatimonadota bacterium]
MRLDIPDDVIDRTIKVLQVFAIVGAYLALLGALMYPVLRAGDYLP